MKNPPVDDALIEAFWDAAEHLGSTDLVLFFDVRANVDPVRAHKRENLINNPEAPEALRKRFAQKPDPKLYHTAFWLVLIDDDETHITSVRLQRIGQGGQG